jgi:hypothetical protein
VERDEPKHIPSSHISPPTCYKSKRPIEQIASVLSATFPLPHKFSTADIDEDACNPLDVEEVYSPLLEGWYAIKIKFDMALYVTVSPVHSRF